MNRFEYLSVLISIILGVGLSETISCWAHLLRQRGVVRFYWVHSGWTLLTLLMRVQFWWPSSRWSIRRMRCAFRRRCCSSSSPARVLGD